MHHLAELDHKYLWHPFTQMADWLKEEPIVITSGKGSVLKDANGREYLDANSSIWTNLHGHCHPRINEAIRRQSRKIAHSSALGFANEPASLLGERLVALANSPWMKSTGGKPWLSRVFYSDDGSTAMEVALKLAYQHALRSGLSKKPKFLSLDGAYHGDTVGAVSLGHIDLFHAAYSGLLFKTSKVPAPYCYRCPFNKAAPQRSDAREYRKCGHECLSRLESKFASQKKRKEPFAAFVMEPRMQGAAGMIAQPEGYARKAAEIARAHGALVILDEVMTGFGRTGSLFACQGEGFKPDFIAVAKGLTGGYLPMAATLTTDRVFESFLGRYDEFKSFFHGHSFTGNQLGAAAALASLDLLTGRECVKQCRLLQKNLASALRHLWRHTCVGDIRQEGLVAGIELVRNWRSREPFKSSEKVGIRVCQAMAERGVLTRPVGNVIVLMPPYCTTARQLGTIVSALDSAIAEVLGSSSAGSPDKLPRS